MLKNCSRCGLDYEGGDGRRVICPPCHVVRGLAKHYFGQPLSAREKQVIEFVRQEMANKEIAHQLHLTTGTIKEYLVIIFLKLGISNRVGLALWAERLMIEQAEKVEV